MDTAHGASHRLLKLALKGVARGALYQLRSEDGRGCTYSDIGLGLETYSLTTDIVVAAMRE